MSWSVRACGAFVLFGKNVLLHCMRILLTLGLAVPPLHHLCYRRRCAVDTVAELAEQRQKSEAAAIVAQAEELITKSLALERLAQCFATKVSLKLRLKLHVLRILLTI